VEYRECPPWTWAARNYCRARIANSQRLPRFLSMFRADFSGPFTRPGRKLRAVDSLCCPEPSASSRQSAGVITIDHGLLHLGHLTPHAVMFVLFLGTSKKFLRSEVRHDPSYPTQLLWAPTRQDPNFCQWLGASRPEPPGRSWAFNPAAISLLTPAFYSSLQQERVMTRNVLWPSCRTTVSLPA
jgi:hypothetical protein